MLRILTLVLVLVLDSFSDFWLKLFFPAIIFTTILVIVPHTNYVLTKQSSKVLEAVFKLFL